MKINDDIKEGQTKTPASMQFIDSVAKADRFDMVLKRLFTVEWVQPEMLCLLTANEIVNYL